MATDVVQAANRAVVPPRDDDGIRVHFHRDVVSRPWNLTRMPGEEPTGAPDAGEVVAINVFVEMEFARQRPAGLATANELFDRHLHVHGMEKV